MVDDAEAAYRELSTTAVIRQLLRQMPFGMVLAVTDSAGKRRFNLELTPTIPSRPAR